MQERDESIGKKFTRILFFQSMELTKRLHEIVFSVLHLYSISFITIFIVTMSRRKIKAKQYIQTKWNYVIVDLQIPKIRQLF